MSESKRSRRMRPVRTASGEVLEDLEDAGERGRRRWWWLGAVWLVLLALAAVSALQWRLGWTDALPHTPRVRAPIALPTQAVATQIAVTPAAAPVDVAAVRKALAPYLRPKGPLGPQVGIVVTGLTGEPAFRSGTGALAPASTLKLLTATAAMDLIGGGKRFQTTVRLSGSTITLVGGGDAYLASKPSATYPKAATLTDLAARTATYLKAHGLRRVSLAYDASRFTGPTVDPRWEPGYNGTVIAPVSSLWVDEARLPTGGYSMDPPRRAAQVFAGLLRAKGIAIKGGQTPHVAAAGSIPIAQVLSAPLVDQLLTTLGDSDNFAAEVIARQVAIAAGRPATFTGAMAAIEQTLRQLAIPLTGLQMYDGSGLSRHDRVAPETIAAILRLAATAPKLAGLVADLPIAGFDGTLSYRFTRANPHALGLVRAKTGTLTGVHSMAGYAVDASGVPLIFVVLADQVPIPQTLNARDDLDRIAAALTTCRCTRP